MSNSEESIPDTPEPGPFEPEFVRMVEKQVRTMRRFDRIGCIGAPLMPVVYVVALVITVGMGQSWYLWHTDTPVETQAEVISLKETTAGPRLSHRVRYEYQAGERTYQGSNQVARSYYQALKVGDMITVFYLKSHPYMSRAEFATDTVGIRDAVFFLCMLMFTLSPFFWLGKQVHRRVRRLPSEKDIQNAELQAVRTLVQIDADPIPRLIFDRWTQQRFKDSDILKYSKGWLSWEGGAEEVSLFRNSRQPIPGPTPPAFWEFKNVMLVQPPLLDMDEFLPRLDFVCRKGFRAYEKLGPIEMDVPTRIMGPDDPRLWPKDESIGGSPLEKAAFFRLLEKTCVNRVDNGESCRAFRIELCGVRREEALQEIREGVWALRTLRFRIEHGRARKEHIERLTHERFPDRFPLITVSQGNEEHRSLLHIRAMVRCVHGLLFFFYACPWRWKPIQRDFILVDQEGAETSVRFTFEPTSFIEVERI